MRQRRSSFNQDTGVGPPNAKRIAVAQQGYGLGHDLEIGLRILASVSSAKGRIVGYIRLSHSNVILVFKREDCRAVLGHLDIEVVQDP